MERDPWLTDRGDDFFEGDDAWEDVGVEQPAQEVARPRRRHAPPRPGDPDRPRSGAGPRLRWTWLAAAAALVAVGIVLAVVLPGGDKPAVTTTELAPTTSAPVTQPAQTTPAPAATQAPLVVTVPSGTTLSLGDTGPAVRTLQRALARVGHDSGKADGVYGPGTEAAVKAFQQGAGLTPDGVVGPATARALTLAQRNVG